MAGATRAGSASGARSTKATPSAKSAASDLATRSASRVLPTPPGPVRVTRRTSGRRKQVDDGRDLALPADEAGQRGGQGRAEAVPVREGDQGHRLGAAAVGGRRVGHGRVLRRITRAAIIGTAPARQPARRRTHTATRACSCSGASLVRIHRPARRRSDVV